MMTWFRKSLPACAALALLSLAPGVRAQTAADAVSDQTLDTLRGGFQVEGFSIGFGADIRSFVDGELVLQSRLTVNPDQSSATFSSGDVLSAQALSDLTGKAGLGGTTFGASTADGVTVFHNLGGGQLSNVLINTSDNRDFRQDLAITLTLPGFEGVQAGMNAARLGQDLAAESSQFAGLAGR
jgi:hypothetical protein